jgi:hypothetical protein
VIKNVALPPPSAEADGDEPTQQRLVLLMPGKIPSLYDYFPGDAYEAYLENPDYGYEDMQVTIPPRIMENMFALADIIPGRYPLRGAESGESMAVIYESILNKMEVKGFNQKTQTEKERYVTAISYLAEEISDPLDVTKKVTRFQMYRRSQELYNMRRLEMENTIDEMRTTLPGIEFEHWFQRNFPTLKSQVEGAYTEWLIFGQKEIVELYKSYLDVESPGVDLEKARMALRASGLASLDRTRTVYPVSFTPGNWYRFLTNVTNLDEAQQRRQMRDRESRDEILVNIGELEAQKRVLIALQAGKPSPELIQEFAALQASLETSNTELTMFADTTEALRQKCLISRIQAKASNTSLNTADCQRYAEASGIAGDVVAANTELYACVSDLDYQINSYELARDALNQTALKIDEQINALKARLASTDIKFSHLARDAQHAADTQDQLDSRWLQFSFDSSRQTQSSFSSYAAKSSRIAASGGARGLFWRASASFSYSRSSTESSFEASMNSAQTQVSGELLRVTIQRPWFRPSLFRSNQFQIRDETARVSPGNLEGEDRFIQAVTEPGANYLLPEYATGLLLSRNINIEFKGISASRAAHAIHVATSTSFRASGGFGFWKASVSGSFSNSRSQRTFSAEATSDGLRISVPGAQIIGYYTQVLPEFPPQ